MQEKKVIKVMFKLYAEETYESHYFFLDSELTRKNLKRIKDIIEDDDTKEDFDILIDFNNTFPLALLKEMQKNNVLLKSQVAHIDLSVIDDEVLTKWKKVPYISDKIQENINKKEDYAQKVVDEIESWLYSKGFSSIDLEEELNIK